MVPFAKAICPVVDARAKTLQVAPPEGLMDLWTTQPLKKVRLVWPQGDVVARLGIRKVRLARSRLDVACRLQMLP